MSNVFDEYPVSGVGPYFITFEYQRQEDVYVLFQNIETQRYEVQPNNTWSFENATTIKLNSEPDEEVIRIQRVTDVNPLRAVFYPGSAIRAQDLNANFEQLMMAIEEGLSKASDIEIYIDKYVWDKLDDTIEYEDQINGLAEINLDDDHIFTAKAIAARSDSYVQESKPTALPQEQLGKIWNDIEDLKDFFWDSGIEAWVSFSTTGAQGVGGPQGEPGEPGKDGGIPEAPNDGNVYGRAATGNTGRWVSLAGLGNNAPVYNFIKPIIEDGTSVKIDLVTLPNA